MADEATTLLTSLTSLLPQLTSPPFSSSTLATVSEQCNLIKQYGRQLEETEKEQLDQMQEELVRLCQDNSLELELRLQLLELIELRSLGWESNESMESFYRDKFEEVEERRERLDRTKEKVEDNDAASTPPEEESLTTADDEVVQEMIQVGPVKLFISSSVRNVTLAARNQLEQFFSSSSNTSDSSQARSELPNNDSRNIRFTAPVNPSPTHMYTREMLLQLATSQESMKSPVNWATRIQSLPRVIVKQM